VKRIALIGMPNTGKSTLFNRLTGSSAKIANWPGVTIDLLAAKVVVGGAAAEIIDLPGIYDLHGFSDDERVVRQFLENNPVDLVAVVLNATQLDHQLPLALQVRELGLPAVVFVNMADEAERLGVRVDTAALASGLKLPVALISARNGSGFAEVQRLLAATLGRVDAVQTQDIRQTLAHDDELVGEAEQLVRRAVSAPSRIERQVTERLDRWLLHPLFGLPLFFLIMFGVFQAIYALGTPIQDFVAWLLDGFRDHYLAGLAGLLPTTLYSFLVSGIYDGIATVASFVPVIILFFFLMSFVEDSGYLARVAFLTDGLMARLGLDGRGFVMMLMGFGCNVPALMGTRVMRNRAMRLLTMLVIPFSLCSARLQVFLFLTTALFSPRQAPLVLFALYVMSFVAAFTTAILFSRRLKSDEPFVLEIPPYRLPVLRQVVMRGWHEVRHFLHRASTFIISGVVLVWFLTHFPEAARPGGAGTYAYTLGQWLAPVLNPIGIDASMAVVLMFGFVAKEIVLGAMVAMTGLEGQALAGYLAQHMDWVQAFSFMLFTLLYTPCVSTLATQRSESRSLGFVGMSVAWSLGLAWITSFIFYQGARLLAG